MVATPMSIGIESLFTQALGLRTPWEVKEVDLNTEKRRIDFQVDCTAKHLACPACGAVDQPIHDRLLRSWRHLDFFQYEAWLHAPVPRVHCAGCKKTTQVPVPWAREGSGFTLLFEALALSLCQSLPTRQAADLLRVTDKRLWRQIEHYVGEARARDSMDKVRVIGIDETSLRRGHAYITVVHDLQAARLLFATPGRDHRTLEDFCRDLETHGGDRASIEHVCMDMSEAYRKGVTEQLPQASISYDRFHVVALANKAMDEVRREEMREEPATVELALGENSAKVRRSLMWAMRKNPLAWSLKQINAMHWLQHSTLKSARAWRLKQALRSIYATSVPANDPALAAKLLQDWISWARRSRLEPFKRLATTLKTHAAGIVRGMLDGRSNAYVEAMNGLLQQAKRAARGYRTATNFIAIAYLRMSKLKHLPQSPFIPAKPFGLDRLHHVCT